MHTEQNVDLKKHSTMRLGGLAKYLCYADETEDFIKLIDWAKAQGTKMVVIGHGSNIIWSDEGYNGLVIVDRTKGRQILEEDADSATIKIASGENWDEVVAWTVEKSLSGFEFLSYIPGTVGSAPVQNIGAYGAEIAESLISVDAIDVATKELVTIPKADCGFDYRTSRFKTTDKGKFIITAITVKLTRHSPEPPFYEALQRYLEEHSIHDYSPLTIRQAVIAIRTSKLPDPKVIANNGSFFTNPIVGNEKFEELKVLYPDIKGWPHKGKTKVAAGWLVEQAGFKGFHDPETGMATYDKQALVLINEHAHSTADLLKFKQKIVDKVEQIFGISLEQEPELIY